MEPKNLKKLLHLVDCARSARYPLENREEGNPFSKPWPTTPIYFLAELKGEEIKDWKGHFEAVHQKRSDVLEGSVKYREEAKIGEIIIFLLACSFHLLFLMPCRL